MGGFPKKERQAIIDGYLAETGRNMFIPAEFIDWLSGQKSHPAYPWFFSKTDKEAAREWRIDLARRMASGLRIVVEASDTKAASVVGLTVREYPAYVSPLDGRRQGGGYAPFDPDDAAMMAELRRQGMVALKSWLNRYGGAFPEAAAITDIVEAYEEGRKAG